MPTNCLRAAAACLIVFLFSISARAEKNWPGWRGPHQTGHAHEQGLPTKWTTGSITWKRSLKGSGQSSPVIWGERIFLTTVTRDAKPEDAKRGLYFGGNRAKPPTVVHQRKVVCLSSCISSNVGADRVARTC